MSLVRRSFFCNRLGPARAVSPFTFRSDGAGPPGGIGGGAHFWRMSLARILQSLSQSHEQE